MLMNALTSSIFLLNKEGFAISTLAPPFCCNKVVIYCYRPVIRVRSYSFQVEGVDCGTRVVDCFIGCYCCYCDWNIYGGGGDGNGNGDNGNGNGDDDNNFLYKDE